MDAAFEFTVNGENMEFAMDLIRNGHAVPYLLTYSQKNVN